MTPIRILQFIGSLGVGGSQNMLINIHKHINKDKIQFDYVLDHYGIEHESYVKTVKDLGAKVFYLPTFKGYNFFEIISAWKKMFVQHPEYRIIHSHVRSYASIVLLIAKKYGIKSIIHSHSINNGNGIEAFIKKILQYPLSYIADYFFACSDEAGKWLFGKKIVKQSNYKVIPNAIDVEKYKFNLIIRKEYRKKLGVSEDTKVYVHVGRFHESKNHKFLLDLFSEIHKNNQNSILVLIGDGELRSQIEKQTKELNLNNKVNLLGVQDNVNCWLQAADCMLFPSLWEGLGIVAIEAQAAGIPCICSEFIPKLVSVSNNCKFIPLNKELWLNEILNIDYTRADNSRTIQKAGFDIKTTSNYLTEFYKGLSCG